MQEYFQALYFTLLVYVSDFMPVPNCFDYCSFVIHFEIRKCETSALSFFFNIVLAIQSDPYSLICIVSYNPIKCLYVYYSQRLKERKKGDPCVNVWQEFSIHSSFKTTMISLTPGGEWRIFKWPFLLANFASQFSQCLHSLNIYVQICLYYQE